MASLSIIFSSVNLTMRISEYLKLTESMSSRISRLEKMHQIAAKRAFEDALRTNDESLRRTYILRAVDKYRDAASVEYDNMSLFGIYVGLACCHGMLNDLSNRNAAIKDALRCYEHIRGEANGEPEGFIEMQSDGDEVLGVMLKGIWGICTLGVANLVNSGIKKIQTVQINSFKEKEKEMRDIASQLRSYI